MTDPSFIELLALHEKWVASVGAVGRKLVLDDADLGAVDLRRRALDEAELRGAHLDEARFIGAELASSVLTRASMRGADLQRANLCGAELDGVDVRGAVFDDTEARRLSLHGADARAARFRRADLRFAYLSSTDLRFADLRGADLDSASLDGARLAGVRLDGARGVERVRFETIDVGETEPVELGGDEARQWLVRRVAEGPAGRRRLAVARIRDAVKVREDLAVDHEQDPAFDEARLTIEAARAEYVESLPAVVLSRCPLTGELFRPSFDPAGIDGPWWDYDAPCRPDDLWPATLISFTGAMRVERVADVPFLVVPGPGVPFVIPRLLSEPSVVAVISQIEVGGNRAWPITYWSTTLPTVELADEWGTNQHRIPGASTSWSSALDDEDDFDFDLGRWVSAGRLRWIAPGDGDWVVRGHPDRCPFLDLAGVREIQYIVDGEAPA